MTSKAVTVQILSIPVAIEEQPRLLLEVKEGQNFTICCKANNYSKPRYQWFHNNTKLEGETSNVLHVCKLLLFQNCYFSFIKFDLLSLSFQIKQFSLRNEGKYYCYIYNDISEIYTERAHVMVKMDNIFSNNSLLCHNLPITFFCRWIFQNLKQLQK